LFREKSWLMRRIGPDGEAISGNKPEVGYPHCSICLACRNKYLLTVRFTWRNQKIRMFGAGYWRKGKAIYEEANG
jgi:hypothetical protein